MPVRQLPEFEHGMVAAGGQYGAGELSECHGAACGMLCRQPQHGAGEFLGLLARLELVRDPSEGMRDCLVSLFEATASQMADEQLRFHLWLPADTEPLELRTRALAHWCSGFLAGLGMGGEAALEALSEDMQSVLTDLQQIARADVAEDGDAEEEETAMVEITEYLRVVTLMLREELRPATPEDSLH